MTTLHSRKSIDPSPLRRGFRFGALALILACFALSPAAHALLPPPPPDGGYPGQNTAEGQNALLNVTNGFNNTANGFNALFATQVASPTRPPVRLRSLTTPPAPTTRLLVLMRSISTPSAPPTRPPAFRRSLGI